MTDRNKNILRSTIAGLFNKIVLILCNILSIPLFINILGQDQYGILLAVLNVFALIMVFDFGIGHSVQNLLTATDRFKKPDDWSSLIALSVVTIYALIMVVSVLMICIMPSLVDFFDDESNLRTVYAYLSSNGFNATLIFMCCWPLIIYTKVLNSDQKVYLNEIFQSIAAVSMLILLLLINFNILPDSNTLSVSLLPYVVPSILAFLYFWINYPANRIPKNIKSFRSSMDLYTDGFRFFGIQVFTVLGNNVDVLLITIFYGPTETTYYFTVKKLFTYLGVTQFVIAPLWPAFGDAILRQDFDWLRLTFLKVFIWTNIVTVLVALVAFLFAALALETWTKLDYGTHSSLIYAFCIWLFLQNNGGLLSMLLNNVDFLKVQFKIISVSGIISFTMQCVLAGNVGLEWFPMIMFLSYTIFYLLPGYIFVYRYFNLAGVTRKCI